MKKIKIMLMSIAVLAVIGGALAFKASFQRDYCTTITIQSANGEWTCPALPAGEFCADLIDYTTQNGFGDPTTYCYTLPPANKTCGEINNCFTYQTLKRDLQ